MTVETCFQGLKPNAHMKNYIKHRTGRVFDRMRLRDGARAEIRVLRENGKKKEEALGNYTCEVVVTMGGKVVVARKSSDEFHKSVIEAFRVLKRSMRQRLDSRVDKKRGASLRHAPIPRLGEIAGAQYDWQGI